MRTRSKAAQIAMHRRVLFVLFVFITIVLLFIVFSNRAAAEDSREIYTYYTSYEIQPGDTLWTIADKYMGPDFTDKETFISNIKSLNNISTDNITAGNYLVIEYSSYEEL